MTMPDTEKITALIMLKQPHHLLKFIPKKTTTTTKPIKTVEVTSTGQRMITVASTSATKTSITTTSKNNVYSGFNDYENRDIDDYSN